MNLRITSGRKPLNIHATRLFILVNAIPLCHEDIVVCLNAHLFCVFFEAYVWVSHDEGCRSLKLRKVKLSPCRRFDNNDQIRRHGDRSMVPIDRDINYTSCELSIDSSTDSSEHFTKRS